MIQHTEGASQEVGGSHSGWVWRPLRPAHRRSERVHTCPPLLQPRWRTDRPAGTPRRGHERSPRRRCAGVARSDRMHITLARSSVRCAATSCQEARRSLTIVSDLHPSARRPWVASASLTTIRCLGCGSACETGRSCGQLVTIRPQLARGRAIQKRRRVGPQNCRLGPRSVPVGRPRDGGKPAT